MRGVRGGRDRIVTRIPLIAIVFLALSAAPGIRPPTLADPVRAASSWEANWTNVTTAPAPQPMAGAMMAYSPRADRFVLFGGWNGTGLNETWVFNPAADLWTRIPTARSPTSRGDGTLVYDVRDDVFLLFGGWHEDANRLYTRLGDTWAFYLGNTTWVDRHPAASPTPRSDAAISYDTADDVVLLFGGFDGSAYLGDAWAYRYSNNSWFLRSGGGTPSPRADGRMVFDAGDDLFFLFGGNDFSGPNLTFHHLADTWTYAWAADRWTQIPAHGSPEARDYAVLAYDTETQTILLVGGYGNYVILGDTWLFDPASDTWTEVASPSSPPARFAGVGGYDSLDGSLVLFSGLGNQGLLADTWVLRLATGVNPAPAAGPGLGLVFLATGLISSFILLVAAGARAIRRESTIGRRENPTREGSARSFLEPEAEHARHR